MPDAGELFDAHHAALYRYLVRFSGDADLAADAAQEAFVRALERPPAGGASRAWLFTVATNVVMEQTRTGTRRARLLAAAPDRAPIADAPPGPHEALESADRQRIVTAALATLSARERTALLLREEGFSHREIAVAVGTTTGTVGTLIVRALARVTERLAPRLETI